MRRIAVEGPSWAAACLGERQIKAHPARFAGLTAVAREIERGKKLELNGVTINISISRLLLEAAAALDMPIYLHPREPAPSMVASYLDYGLYFAPWGSSAECPGRDRRPGQAREATKPRSPRSNAGKYAKLMPFACST